jgi:hypothetical protein
MSFDQCTFSQESAVDYSQTSSLDTGQLSLLSGMDTPAKFCENAPQMDGSPDCMCGKGTSDCLIHPSTPDKWIASMRDSLARTLALLESRQVYLREPDRVFTAKSCGFLTSLDLNTFSWKTCQLSLIADLEQSYSTWPRWGMTLGGAAFVHPMSDRRMSEIGGGCWPTPQASDCRKVISTFGSTLRNRKQIPELGTAEGWINPELSEWLMGFPIKWTDSKLAATHKSPSRPQQHGDCSEAPE